MKRLFKKSQKIVKGMPSAVALSILIHVALFLLAGMLVVFTVVKKEEKQFIPPKAVERPKMKLRKPKVKVKKTSKPKPTTRIVTKVTRANMPDIQLPEISGMGEGLSGGIGGFEMMPDFEMVSMFGGKQSIGNDFEGTIYDFKRDRRGKPLSLRISTAGFYREIAEFIKSDWNISKLSRFYRSPNKLYSPTIMIPSTLSHLGPLAFNEPDMAAYAYMLHYKGQLVNQKGGRFRFWCMGDNCMVVRVNGRVVLDFGNKFADYWEGENSRLTDYHLGHWPAYSGQWIDLEPGVPQEMEVLFGEYEGGLFAAMLVIEEEGVDYPKNLENGPMLPIFKTAELSRDQIDSIYEFLPENHYSVTNGPVFSDYSISKISARNREIDDKDGTHETLSDEKAILEPSAMRHWTLKNGKSVDAELVVQIGDNTVLKSTRGKQVKIPTRAFSEEDLDYLELASPPTLKIIFLKDTDTYNFKEIPNPMTPPVMYEITAGVKIKKINQKPYTKELRVELFSIASEIDGDNFVLLDRQTAKYTPSEENGGIYELWGKKAYMKDYLDADAPGSGNRRGEKLKGHMIVVTDERGEIIAQDISNDWMLDIIDFLRTFPIGRHFNKEGERVYPPRAKIIRHWWSSDVSIRP